MEKYYQDLLASNVKSANNTDNRHVESEDCKKESTADCIAISEKWKGQIEKVFGLPFYCDYR